MGKSRLLGGLMCVLLFAASSTCALASWEEDGNAICAATNEQSYPRCASDGTGGAIITWQDFRSASNHDIYARRVDGYGNVLWTTDGVAISTATGSQYRPQAVSDGFGGAIITWEDGRGADLDIYAQRVDASGNVQWTPDGIVICTATGYQYNPQITADGFGGAIITWEDERGADVDIYARRVDASGNVLWTPDGVAVCAASDHQYDHQVTSDGAGGAVITWQDLRGGVDNDIYAQRVDGYGNVLWTVDGTVVSALTGDQLFPRVTSDGAEGAIITWEDGRGADVDIYAQRVDGYGNVRWTVNGLAICIVTGDQHYPQVASDGAGGAIIAWQDDRGGNSDVYAQQVDGNGNVLWGANGRAISISTGDQYVPQVTSDGDGGAVIAWLDLQSDMAGDIYAQRVDGSGNTLWPMRGAEVSTAPGQQVYPRVTSDEAGGAVITWQDYRSPITGSDIYAQRIERNGYWGYPCPDICAIRDVPGDQGGFVNLAWDASRLDPWPEMHITEYTVWRAISAEAVSGMIEEGAYVLTEISDTAPKTESSVLRVDEAGGEKLYWKLMTTLDAYYVDTYSEVAPTLFDSTSVCDERHYFQVIAHTVIPSMFWVSEVDSGYSVDNLSPDAPQGVAGDYSYPPAELLITWERNEEADLLHYAVYKGSHEGFVPDADSRLATVCDTFFVDDAFDPNLDSYYKLSAWDIHGNESQFSLLRPDEISGVGGPPATPPVTRLEQNVPNPFNPVTAILFSLAQAGWVELRVYDVAGRPVRTLIHARREADRYRVTWDGRDDDGRSVASGVYLYQLDAPGYREMRKMVLLR